MNIYKISHELSFNVMF